MTLQDPLGYAGRRVVVSGCYSGIGAATARLLIALGAEVHGLDYKASTLDLHAFTLVDLRDPATIEHAVARIGGRVDALFNCAGIPPGPPALDVMKVNYIGTRHLTQLLLPMMAAGSAIANVASTGGAGWSGHLPALRDLVAAAGYDAGVQWCEQNLAQVAEGYRFSKEAIIAWTLLDAAPMIQRGIRINCTIPGAVQTPMLEEIERTTPTATIDVVAQPIGRRSSAEEQALPLLLLNSPGAGYLNGVALPVDGGFTAQATLARLT